MTVDTPRTQAIIGQPDAKPLRNLSIDLENHFAAILLTSLDGKPISSASKLLLVTGAVTANTGMEWNEKRTSVVKWGTDTDSDRAGDEAKSRFAVWTAQPGSRSRRSMERDSQSASRIRPNTRRGWQMQIGGQATTWYRIQTR